MNNYNPAHEGEQRPTRARRRSYRTAAVCVVTAAATLLSVSGLATTSAVASSKTANIVVGFSQSYTGNSYRKTLDATFNTEFKLLKAEGQVSSYVFEDAASSCTTQESQISDMIIEHVAVLVIDPCSPTALNGVIAKAVSAGIPVLDLNDGPVTATARHYELNCAQTPIMESEIAYEAKRLNGHGKILDIRGIAGTESDVLYQVGLAKELKIYPGIKVVASVYGNWTDSVAESATAAVLPSLPTINGVVSQGGEEYGAVEAFEAAGRAVPIIWGGNRGNFLHWWVSEYKKNGYTTESESNNPGIGAAAMYVAVQIAAKKQVPHNMVMPNLLITQATLNKYLSVPVTGVAYKIYSASWFKSNLLNQGRNAASVYLDGPWPPASS